MTIPATLIFALALSPPRPANYVALSDPRIEIVTYVSDQVVTIRVQFGYATVVEFASDEAVDSVIVGSSSGWQIAPNGRGDRLVIKPLPAAAATNMIVTTNKRRYVFVIEPSQDQSFTPFVIKYVYGTSSSASESDLAAPMATYVFSGDKTIRPLAMTDDGQHTTISWKPDVALPAIFSVDQHGREALVNGRMSNGSYVVEGVAPRFVLRLGEARAVATRKLNRIQP